MPCSIGSMRSIRPSRRVPTPPRSPIGPRSTRAPRTRRSRPTKSPGWGGSSPSASPGLPRARSCAGRPAGHRARSGPSRSSVWPPIRPPSRPRWLPSTATSPSRLSCAPSLAGPRPWSCWRGWPPIARCTAHHRPPTSRAALLQQQGFTDASVPDLQKVLVLSGDLGKHDWAAGLLAEQAQILPHD